MTSPGEEESRLSRAALLFVLLWTAANLLLLRRFPTVLVDEAENVNHAWNLARAGRAVFSLYDGLYPENLSFLRHAWPVVIRPFFVRPLSWLLSAAGLGLGRARLLSLLAAAASLGLTFDLGRRLRDGKLGLAAMVLLGARFPFLYAAHVARPEALLALDGLLCFWLLERGRGKSFWWTAAAGLAAGMAPGIHTNGVVLLPAFALALAGGEGRRRAPAALLGAAVGFGWFLLAADWSLFRPGVDVLFFKEFASPPLFKHRWDLFTPIVEEADRYFGSWQFLDWRGGGLFRTVFGWESILCLAALGRAAGRPGPARGAALTGLAITAGFVWFVGQKAVNYLALSAPWAALALADWLTDRSVRAPLADAAAALAASVALFPLGGVPLTFLAFLFFTLPGRLLRPVLLVALLAVFLNLPSARGWLLSLPAGFRDARTICLAGTGLLAGLLFSALRRGRRPAFSVDAWARGAAPAVAAASLVFAGSVAFARPSFDGLCRSFSEEMAPGSRVAGPQTLWLGLSSYEYRDVGALVWHRLLLNRRDLTPPLAAWKPDYVILDGPMVRRLRQGRPSGPVFPWPFHVVKEVDGGSAYGGPLLLVKMDWTEGR